MALERLPVIVHLTRFRDVHFSAKKILGSEEGLGALEAQDVIAQTALVNYPEVRAIALIPLLHKQTGSLPLEDRLGLLCFTALVMEADRVIDSEHLRGVDRDTLESGILSARMKTGGYTLGQLRDAAFTYVPQNKADAMASFLDAMLTYHTQNGFMRAGTYGFADALAYRRHTNDSWVDTTFLLAGIDDEINKEWIRSAGLVAQFRDDLRDWAEDWDQKSYNLFLGLTRDFAPQELEHLERGAPLLAHLPEQERKVASRAWAKTHAPRSRKAYGKTYYSYLSRVPDVLSRVALAIKGVD